MTAGLQIWDASGNVVLDASYRVGRIINSKYLDDTGTPGSVTDSRMAGGAAFWSFQPNMTNGDGFLSGGVIAPRFSIDTASGALSWTYAAKNNPTYDVYQSGTLLFGAY